MFRDHVTKVKNIHGIYFQTAIQQLILNLQGLTNSVFTWNTDNFNEEKYLGEIQELGVSVSLHFYYIVKSQLFFLFEDYSQARKMAVESEKRFSRLLDCCE